VTGIDIIQEQIRVAAGEPLPITGTVKPRGHAIEFRINAEDPTNNFLPRAGTINKLVLPGGPGVRVDTHLYQGYVVPPHYDSLLAKLVVWGRDRQACIARGRRALRELVVEGVPTTRNLHLDILEQSAFVEGRFSTSFLDEVRDQLPTLSGGKV